MLTFRETDLLIASEINEQFRIKKEIFYTEPKSMPVHKHDEDNGKHNCGFCNKTVT